MRLALTTVRLIRHRRAPYTVGPGLPGAVRDRVLHGCDIGWPGHW